MKRENKNLSVVNNTETLFSENDAANKLNVPYTTLRFWRQIGKVDYIPISSGRVAYSEQNLNKIREKILKAAA